MTKPETRTVVRIRDLVIRLGGRNILDGLDLDAVEGEILGIVGGSGSGKSVLLRTIIGLLPFKSGRIELFGQEVSTLSYEQWRVLEKRWGIMFQRGALFSSLTVRENIQFQMREALSLSAGLLEQMTNLKLELVGLNRHDGDKMPSQLSGGMVKRAALARALALDPEFLLLDEPTSGLDPISAGNFDELIQTLKSTLGLTVFFVTHDLESLRTIADRIAVVADGKIVAEGDLQQMLKERHPWVKSYFQGHRGNAIFKPTHGPER